MCFFFRLGLGFTLLFGGCLPGSEKPSVRQLRDSVITLDTVWSGEVVIDGTVKVAKGAKLVIAPGTDIRFVRRDRDQDGLGDATLVVEGELLAIGREHQPIRFRSAEAQPQPGDWLEIRVDFSRNTTLRWCEIRDSANTLHAHFTKGIMEDCHIHHNIDGTRLGEARFVIRHNLFEDNLGKGINFRNATVEISRNIIRRNRAGLFLFETDRESAIHHNNFVDNGDNLRLGDFFTGTLAVRDNWWGRADQKRAAATIYDRKADPAIGTVTIDPAAAWLHEAGPRRKLELHEAWRFETGAFVDSPVIGDGERYYVPGWDARLHALGKQGTSIMSIPLADVGDSRPLLSEGRLFVQDWSRTVHAFDAASGATLWQFTYPASPADDHRQGGLARSGDTLLVPTWNGTLYGLDMENGAVRWSYLSAGALRSSPLVRENQIVIASEDGDLHALSTLGEQRWRFTTGSPLRAAPVSLGDGLVAVNRAGRVVALDASGQLRWERALDEESFYAAPLVADEAVFVATAAGSLFKLAADSGATLWRRDLASSLFTTPVLTDGRLAVGDNCGRLHLIDMLSGETLATFAAADAIQSPPLVLDGQLVFGARDGFVRAVSLQVPSRRAGESR